MQKRLLIAIAVTFVMVLPYQNCSHPNSAGTDTGNALSTGNGNMAGGNANAPAATGAEGLVVTLCARQAVCAGSPSTTTCVNATFIESGLPAEFGAASYTTMSDVSSAESSDLVGALPTAYDGCTSAIEAVDCSNASLTSGDFVTLVSQLSGCSEVY